MPSSPKTRLPHCPTGCPIGEEDFHCHAISANLYKWICSTIAGVCDVPMLRPSNYRSLHEFAPNALHTRAQNNCINRDETTPQRRAFSNDLWYVDSFASNTQKPNERQRDRERERERQTTTINIFGTDDLWNAFGQLKIRYDAISSLDKREKRRCLRTIRRIRQKNRDHGDRIAKKMCQRMKKKRENEKE